MSLHLQTHPVVTPDGTRAVLVACPTEHIVVGADRIGLLREQSDDKSEVDHMVLDYISAQPVGHLRAFVFRGTSDDGTGSWRMDPTMSSEQCDELAYLMFRSQLSINRACAVRGMLENFYVDWPQTLVDSFAKGSGKVADELRAPARAQGQAGSLARLDLWVAERHTFLAEVPLRHLLGTILPLRIERVEERLPRLRQLMTDAGLDPRAL